MTKENSPNVKVWRIIHPDGTLGAFALREDRVVLATPNIKARTLGKSEVEALNAVMDRVGIIVEEIKV